MSSSTISVESRSAAWWARVGDYIELTKPRIAVLVLITVGVSGYVARWGQVDLVLMLHALLGTFLVAGSASAMNHWLEQDSDRLMARTAQRPLPAGRLSSARVLLFATLTAMAGIAHLALAVNIAASAWAFATWIVYVWMYTPLKSRTSWNTAVGAVSGALPMMIGWSAAGGSWNLLDDPRSAALFLILFLWQFPHFMAIAWIYRRQYDRAGLKMLTVVDSSGRKAGVQAVLAALTLLPVSLVPALMAPAAGAALYMTLATLLGVGQLAFAMRFFVRRDEPSARRLLHASLIYLPALMLSLVVMPWI